MSTDPYASPSTQDTLNDGPLTDDIAKQLDGIQYPLKLSFKVLALARQATVTDANGRVILYTKQKLLKFREHVEIFTDKSKSTKLADIRTKKIIDWSARYFFTDSKNQEIGSVGRRGWRSLWKAHYESFNPGDDTPDFSIRELNPWAKVFDSLFGEIPILGILTGYLFHPKYAATRSTGEESMRLTKQAAFFESTFIIEKQNNLSLREELNLFLSFMMLVMLERRRG